MRAWTCIALLAIAACGLGDDTADGTRDQCAEGGELNNTCSGAVTTPEQACWRMVDCGAIPLHQMGGGEFDWSRCVEQIERTGDPQARLIMGCVGASTCDQLKANSDACFAYGGN
jgi:hypothetical protein